MKFIHVANMNINWPAFLREMPASVVSELNQNVANVQSIEGYIKLLSRLNEDCDYEIDDYLLQHVWWSFYYESSPALLLDFNKVNMYILAYPNYKHRFIHGIVTGTIKQWIDLCNLGDKPHASDELKAIIPIIKSLLVRENLASLTS
jgi:hypothetical protein